MAELGQGQSPAASSIAQINLDVNGGHFSSNWMTYDTF
jgi:hypothetical protein